MEGRVAGKTRADQPQRFRFKASIFFKLLSPREALLEFEVWCRSGLTSSLAARRYQSRSKPKLQAFPRWVEQQFAQLGLLPTDSL